MISLFKSILLTGLIYSIFSVNSGADVKRNCTELGVSFTLPSGFLAMDSEKIEALSKRGEKAVKESYDKETLKSWQPACFNLQDSLKRLISIATITEQEAIDLSGSVDKFIDGMFMESNDFVVKRLKARANINIDTTGAITESELVIAGQKVRKNAITLNSGPLRLFYARYYFFRKNQKLYLLSFLGSPKAKDNDSVTKAIESGVKI